MKAKNKTKKLVKATYSVGDYIVFKTIFGFNEGVVVEVIDESAVSVGCVPCQRSANGFCGRF